MAQNAGRGNLPLIDFGPDSRHLTHSSSSPSPGRRAWRPCPAGTSRRCWTLQFAAISCHTRRTSCARSSRGSRPARAHSTDNLRKPSLFSSHKSGTCRLRTPPRAQRQPASSWPDSRLHAPRNRSAGILPPNPGDGDRSNILLTYLIVLRIAARPIGVEQHCSMYLPSPSISREILT